MDPTLKMKDVSCQHLGYSIGVPLDKFNLENFKRAIHAKEDSTGDHRLCNTKNPDLADYHVHFSWRVREKAKQVELRVDYAADSQQPETNEFEPYAEDVMLWLGQFFKFEDASARFQADFDFEGKRQPFFLLPLKITITELGAEAAIDGISVELPSQPDGIQRLFISQVKDTLFLGIQGERRIYFGKFSVPEELRRMKDLTDKLVR